MKTEAERKQHEKECRICWDLVSALSELCVYNPEKTVDLLTGYLWDKEEGEMIKRSREHTKGEENE